MVAEVYPIQRMPRRVKTFDYLVTDQFPHLKRGDVVVVPFRNKTIYGVVAKLKNIPERGITLKSILKKDERISFCDEELSYFEFLSQDLVQSVGSILYSCLPAFPKRETIKRTTTPQRKKLTIPSHEHALLQSIAQQLAERNRAFASVSDLRRMACVLSEYLYLKKDQKCIVLCTTITDAERLYTYLPTDQKFLFTSEENQGDQFRNWYRYRNAESGIFIGTKNVLFLTDSKTTTLFILRSSHENHGHHEQNPKFDARTIAFQLASHYKTNLFFLDVMPRVDDFHFFSKTNRISSQLLKNPEIINMEQEGVVSPIGTWISNKTFLAIQECLESNQRILLVFNKKYQAKRLVCTSCHTPVVCSVCQNGIVVDGMLIRCIVCKQTEPMIRSCSVCHQLTLKESGFGNQKIDALLKDNFPNAITCIVDKDHQIVNPHAQIVIATSFYLEQMVDIFSPESFHLIVLLDADAPLYQPTFRATEKAIYNCEQWRALAHACKASYFIQTRSPILFSEYVQDADGYLQQELENRRAYAQPPFRDVVEIRFSEKEQRRAEIIQNKMIQQIRMVSTHVLITKTISASEYTLVLRFPSEERSSLLNIFRSVPDHVMIDTQAQTG